MLVKPKIKYIQTLGQKKFRQEEGRFLAEGPKLVEELLQLPGVKVEEVFSLPEWADAHQPWSHTAVLTTISPAELEKISQLSTPNQVLAIVKQFEHRVPAALSHKITLVLDTIQDPGNLGTIIRIADWFGIEQIVCSPDCADMYNSKVIQSTMGSIGRVHLYYTELVQWLTGQKNVRIYATALHGRDITGMEKIQEGIIVIGNESKGISEQVLQLANVKITIPQKGKAESLNAAVATGIILSHVC